MISYRYIKNSRCGHTLLFLHGFRGNSSIWDDHVEILKDKFSIVLVDMVGHGGSETPQELGGYSFENQAGQIAEILDNLNINSVTVVSYSFSCHTGILLREKLGDRAKKMIFVSPYFKEKFNFFERWLFKFIKLVWKYLVPDKTRELDYNKLRDYENTNLRDEMYILKTTNTKDYLGSAYAMSEHEGIPTLDMGVPVLIIHGQDDKMLTDAVKGALTEAEGLEIKVMEGKKHLFLKTEPQKVARLIKDFVGEN